MRVFREGSTDDKDATPDIDMASRRLANDDDRASQADGESPALSRHGGSVLTEGGRGEGR